jgi:hypothetical protein
MRLLAFCALVALALPLSAADEPAVLKVPAEVKAAPATIAEVRAETAGKLVKWVVLTPGLSVRPIDDGRVLLVSGPAGRYELLAYTALGDVPSDPARCVVVIGDAPGPGPGPNPKPPEPPPDSLRVKLKAAFDADPAPSESKREHAKDLAALYCAAAKLAEDASVPTSGELLRRVRDAAGTLIGSDALREVRRVAGNELSALLPTDAPLSPQHRTSAAALFRKLATILEELTS